MSKELVSVIVVTAGVNNYIFSCLDSVYAQTYAPTEAIVINNSLSSELALELEKRYTEIKLYAPQVSLSYCQALNIGFKESDGEFVLCLNDDVILEDTFIELAKRGFARDTKIGMVSGKVLRSDKVTIDSTGLYVSVWRAAKERGYGHRDRGQFEKKEYIFGVNGAVAFYRRAMLDQIKVDTEYFDEDFRFFYEDLDIAWRAQHCGWKGYFIPTAIAYHARGGTARKEKGIDKPYARRYLSDELHLDLIKNRYLTIIKNEAAVDFFLYLPFMLLYDLALWGYVLLFRPRLLRNGIGCLAYVKPAFKKRRLIKEKLHNISLDRKRQA